MWNPALWDDFGVVGLVVAMAFLLFLSLQRGWLVLGIHHREIVDAKNRELAARDREIEANRSRADKDVETIRTLSQTVLEKNAMEEATTRLLGSVRELASGGGR